MGKKRLGYVGTGADPAVQNLENKERELLEQAEKIEREPSGEATREALVVAQQALEEARAVLSAVDEMILDVYQKLGRLRGQIS